MTATLAELVLDALHPPTLAGFWAKALGWHIGEVRDGRIELVPTDSTSFRLLLRPVLHHKVGQNRIHFDLTTTSIADQRETVASLLTIGAAHVDIGQDPAETHVVLADPERNEFCVLEPFSTFLAGCPRLGAVNCDGTHALGSFWSEALGWPLVWDEGEETAIQSPNGSGPKLTWSGPPLMPKPERERFHVHVTPTPGARIEDTVEALIRLGAVDSSTDLGCPASVVLADVDGNDFCVIL